MDDLLLGYLLDALDPAEAAAVAAHLHAHPGDAAKLEKLRRLLRPLEADRDDPAPPPGLAVAALARVAEHLVATGQHAPAPADLPATDELPVPPELFGLVPPPAETRRAGPGRALVRRWAEAAVAAAIGFLAVGLILGGVQKVRYDNRVAACQNNLRVLYQGLDGYAAAHDKYPQVGPNTPAGSFVTALVAADHFPADLKLVCPAAVPPPELEGFHPDRLAPPGPDVIRHVGYTYPLGYRGPGGVLVGPRRADADAFTPLAADLPARSVAPTDGPVSPHGWGQNVLYADGRAQFFTTAGVGPGGDDIYRNAANQVRAGLFPTDASLGRPTDEP